MVQNWSRTNKTSQCENVVPAVIILPANESSIRIAGGQVVVSGSGDSVHSALIILRDIISPDWVRVFHGLN